jgi:hypothetical protein
LSPDDDAARRPSYCYFHGVQILRVGTDEPTLRGLKGRMDQCGLFTGRFTVCRMVGEGKSADWEKCPFNPRNTEQLSLL